MPFFRPVKTKKRSKRYDKISHKSRVMLLKKVLCDHSEIKEVTSRWFRVQNNCRSTTRLPRPSCASTNTMVIKSTRQYSRESAHGMPSTRSNDSDAAIGLHSAIWKPSRLRSSSTGVRNRRPSTLRHSSCRRPTRQAMSRPRLRFSSKFFSNIDSQSFKNQTFLNLRRGPGNEVLWASPLLNSRNS